MDKSIIAYKSMNKNNKLSEIIGLHPDYSARFSNHLLRLLLECAEDDRNISVSPARLQAVLVLLANWAPSSIQKRILEMVGNDIITLSEANLLSSKQLLSATQEDWVGSDDICVPLIELSTILWAQHNLDVKIDALKTVTNEFPIIHKPVDFKDPDVKSIIDNYITEATHDLIKELNVDLSQDTVAIITDILYFNARWHEVFEPENTKEQLFYGTKGRIKVPMMKRTGYMEYCETSHCQMVKLPYVCFAKEDIGYSMRVYLPKPKHSFEDVLHERWDDQFSTYMEEVEVKLSLPRFTVDASINMKQTLANLGLSCIYDSKDVIPGLIKNLQIEQIVQQTKVKVIECGTEAAAVTSVGMCLGCCPFEKPKPTVMTVNRPFIFEIAEDRTNTILFTGIVNNIE